MRSFRTSGAATIRDRVMWGLERAVDYNSSPDIEWSGRTVVATSVEPRNASTERLEFHVAVLHKTAALQRSLGTDDFVSEDRRQPNQTFNGGKPR